MRRIITLALLILTVSAGSAMADRYRGDHRGDNRGYRNHDRSYRNHDRGYRNHDRRVVVRDHRHGNYRHHVQPRRDYRYVDRRPVHVHNNRFVFNGGYTRSYVRPFIQYRYTNYRARPQILVENYDTVPGYVWIAGHWDWNGYEWQWNPGHYEVDASYQYEGYGYSGY